MPQKTAARLRELLEELKRAQTTSGDVADKARKDLAEILRRTGLDPVGAPGTAGRATKARRKKR